MPQDHRKSPFFCFVVHLTYSSLLAYHRLQVPSNAPFELKPSPGKGWGAFATRRIERGTLILREKPLFVIQKPEGTITEKDVFTAFQQLTPSEKQLFHCLRNNASTPFVFKLHALCENSFALPNSIRPTDPPFHGLFLLHSRFNHSCIPNAKVPIAATEIIEIFATRDIVAGEEITFCYNTGFEYRIRHDRHQELRFVCECKACLPDTPFQRLSDMRRTLIRGLQYLTKGVDIDGQRQSSASPIIIDRKLKKAAENFSIPLSNRLIYNLLIMSLLEDEGLMDDFVAERVNPGILEMVSLFRTESNARIASLAMKQETALGKFCVAFRLYGKSDVGDHIVTLQLRRLRGLS